MEITCPHCNVNNNIAFADHISCKECDKSFKGKKFSERKFISATTALAIGAFGGYKVNTAWDETRYPLNVEYAIVDTCLNSAKNLIAVSRYENKREICLCSLEKTMEVVPYSSFNDDQGPFLAVFRQKAKTCK
ncbi:hypothetical protein ACFFLZ_16145 [Photobacterium aphoticum]|uniref:Uncharacterized protein n=1 Tax=Photobacterium aphoticum TaxID=754436 RepID=A0A0J1JE92_9GAMM|nr:hypothetical protein [Photobacterium aphoticum]KLU99996.1 hypothetical protein ABT58_13440 [Photobacterium aphoticum]PSU58576.1 hypothetical protein C9I90_06400 [Photobacterium aphoticum]GHA48037.1 hypothetical protein GCM10007086_22090 [Photobacterium aphoticum]